MLINLRTDPGNIFEVFSCWLNNTVPVNQNQTTVLMALFFCTQ